MAAKKGKITIHGRFPAGAKVSLIERGSADVYAGAGEAVTTATTDKDGATTFDAPFGNYFAVATVKDWNVVLGAHEDRLRSVDVTIAPKADPPEAPLPIGPEPPASMPNPQRLIIGARSSIDGDVTFTNTQLVDEKTGAVSEFASPVGHVEHADADGTLAPRQEDHRDVPLASSTLTGEAVAPAEQPSQQEDSGKVPQASDTETGTQAPVIEAVRQEDAEGPQASDTETGTATPVVDRLAPEPKPKKKRVRRS